jgi:polysaccharide chain length determinant protein (PEP-CTERM system associated)
LEEQKAQEAAEARRRQMLAKGAQRASSATNPVFQQLKISLAEAEANVAALRARSAELQSRLNQLRAAAGRVPQVEAEMAQLNRDYDIIRKNYEQLASRRESASMSEEVDTNAGLADFRVIEPPRVDQTPVFPNRLSLVPLALLVALGAGIFASFAMSQAFPTFQTIKSLRQIAARPVLGTVAMVRSAAVDRRERMENLAFGGALATLILSYGAWAALAALHVSRA